jgi:hypothetical protein
MAEKYGRERKERRKKERREISIHAVPPMDVSVNFPNISPNH